MLMAACAPKEKVVDFPTVEATTTNSIIIEKVELTDDPKADLARIQQMYEDMHLVGKHPNNYLTK